MATYTITGKMGTGKTKSAVRIMQLALEKGLRVATNIDLTTEKLNSAKCKSSPIRIPDKPTVEDLECIGIGNDTYDEDLNGVIVLDELASWLNSRTFNDKSRQPVLDWLIHSRKKGWHVYFICQNLTQIDKQVRESLVEFTVRCSRLDKIKIPFVGWFLNMFNEKMGYLPRMHIASVRMGTAPDGVLADKLYYRGDDLHAAYDTRQIFTDRYAHGSHSVLSCWHVYGRYLVVDRRSFLAKFFSPRTVAKLRPAQSVSCKLMLNVSDPEKRFRLARAYIQMRHGWGLGGGAERPRPTPNHAEEIVLN